MQKGWFLDRFYFTLKILKISVFLLGILVLVFKESQEKGIQVFRDEFGDGVRLKPLSLSFGDLPESP